MLSIREHGFMALIVPREVLEFLKTMPKADAERMEAALE
jgi:hypothetical protein